MVYIYSSAWGLEVTRLTDKGNPGPQGVERVMEELPLFIYNGITRS